MTHRDVNRCAVKGCPVVGHWPPGTRCPMHADPFDGIPGLVETTEVTDD